MRVWTQREVQYSQEERKYGVWKGEYGGEKQAV